MKKWILRFASIFVVIGLLIGCAPDENNNGNTPNESQVEENEEMIVIKISKDKEAETIKEKELPIKEGAILLDVMKENFEVEEDGGFITSIEGVEQEEDEQKYWLYFINGEAASIGAGDYELTAGDEITFDLQATE